jgi:hypothetical protein
MEIMIRDVMCNLVDTQRRFAQTCCSHIQGRRVKGDRAKDKDSRLIRNVGSPYRSSKNRGCHMAEGLKNLGVKTPFLDCLILKMDAIR